MRSRDGVEELRASLVAAAKRVVSRGGGQALTIRALAAEAGCSVGLPYKVFDDRRDLVAEVIHSEFLELSEALDELTARAGTGTVGGNLAGIADILLGSPAVALAHETFTDEHLMKLVTGRIHSSGAGPASFEAIVSRYLAAEQRVGRVDADVDVDAFAFVIAGAVHNLIVSGAGYPRPGQRQLRRMLDAVAARLVPPPDNGNRN